MQEHWPCRQTAARPACEFDAGYGLVCHAAGRVIDDLIVAGVNQEHGLITTMRAAPIDFDDFSIGTQLRILPNHACMTAAAYQIYHVLDDKGRIAKTWPRINHW